MITIDEALERLTRDTPPLPEVRLPLAAAQGRVLAADITAGFDLPAFAQSAMDGFALRSRDAAAASPAAPVELRLAGVSAAGPASGLPDCGAGEAVRIMTGATLPSGADAVVKQEDVVRVDGAVRLVAPVAVGTHVRQAGEELRTGQTLATAGSRLTAGLIGSLAVAGVEAVTVRRAPRVGVIVTGDELLPLGASPQPGLVYDANGPVAAAWLSDRRAELVATRRVVDALPDLAAAIGSLLPEVDVLITTGGASVGDRDFVREACARNDVETCLWGVAQQPGKPLFAGRRGNTWVLGLPGNPGAVFVGLSVHARRLLDCLEGAAEPGPSFARAPLAAAFKPNPQRDIWARCVASSDDAGQTRLWPLGRQASHMMSNLDRCDALARIPAGTQEMPVGTPVSWCRL